MKTKVIIVLATMLAAGCSTTGSLNGTLTKYDAFYFDDADPMTGPLQKEISYTLAHYGLQTISATNRHDVLRCRVETDMGSVWNYSVKVVFFDDEKSVISVQASNNGWGTAIANGAAVNNLYSRTVQQLEAELEKGGLHKHRLTE